jgi:hypothetical protein
MDVTQVLRSMRQLRLDFYILETGRPVDADFFFRVFPMLDQATQSNGYTYLSYSKMMVDGKKSRLFRLIIPERRGAVQISYGFVPDIFLSESTAEQESSGSVWWERNIQLIDLFMKRRDPLENNALNSSTK